MSYETLADHFSMQPDIEISTMMSTPCLRYRGEFVAMMFAKEDSLIVKVSPERVLEIIQNGDGNEFNFTGKRFKEWVLIPSEFEEKFEGYVREAIQYAKQGD